MPKTKEVFLLPEDKNPKVSMLAMNKEVESRSIPISGDRLSTKKEVVSTSPHRCIWGTVLLFTEDFWIHKAKRPDEAFLTQEPLSQDLSGG